MDHALELTSRAEASHFWFRGFRRFLAPVLGEIANGRAGLRIVDCGCGTGHNLSMLSAHGAAYGFDVTTDGLVRARARGRTVLRADIEQAPFPDDTFDIATSFDVMQCISGDVAAVCEMARMVRPGGHVVVTMAALEILRGDHSVAWQEVKRYTPARVRRLMREAGLETEHVSFLFGSIFPLMWATRTAQRLLRPFRPARADADIAVPSAPVNAVLTWILACEAAVRRRWPAPIGSSLLVVARKPWANQNRTTPPK